MSDDLAPETGAAQAEICDAAPNLQNQIKSRERVRDLAEVFTHDREVKAMLDLVPDMFESIDTTFLEPACGNGNFLVRVLERKLELICEADHGGTENWLEFAVLRCVASIYGIDINDENVAESHERMVAVAEAAFDSAGAPCSGFPGALREILAQNVICSDALSDAGDIEFLEWKVVGVETLAPTPFALQEQERNLFFVPPEPLPPRHFSELDEACYD